MTEESRHDSFVDFVYFFVILFEGCNFRLPRNCALLGSLFVQLESFFWFVSRFYRTSFARCFDCAKILTRMVCTVARNLDQLTSFGSCTPGRCWTILRAGHRFALMRSLWRSVLLANDFRWKCFTKKSSSFFLFLETFCKVYTTRISSIDFAVEFVSLWRRQ